MFYWWGGGFDFGAGAHTRNTATKSRILQKKLRELLVFTLRKLGGIKEGRKEGTDETIIKLIPDLFALSNDRQAVIKILMNKMGLGQEQAESYYQRAMAAEPKEKQ